jgi:hypothetical protein
MIDAMTLANAAIDILRPDLADDLAVEMLAQATAATREEAWDAVIFVPLAFTRILLDEIPVQFSDTYFLRKGKNTIERRFADKEIYIAAVQVAKVMKSRGAGRRMAEIASQSAEFLCINKALNAGNQLQDIKSLPPPVVWIS